MLQRILYSIKFAHKTKGNWYKDRIMRSDKSFQLKFGGDDTGIDAKFFAETIQNLSTLLNVAQSEIGTDTTSKLKITQTSAGSFCVDFSLFVETAVPLFFMLNTNGAQHIVKTFIEFIKFIKLKKFCLTFSFIKLYAHKNITLITILNFLVTWAGFCF